MNKPAKLFRLPYSHEFYVCTCDAKNKDDCTCDQETLVTTRRNPYLADAEFVGWLQAQSEPFSTAQAIEALGLTELAGLSKSHAFAATLEALRELKKCGCTCLDSGLFTRPSCETLTGLNLRQPARHQSQTEAQPTSQDLPVRHPGHSPAPHEDHQSTAADPATDLQLPQQST